MNKPLRWWQLIVAAFLLAIIGGITKVGFIFLIGGVCFWIGVVLLVIELVKKVKSKKDAPKQ